ncbi:MAG TPA: hypothetical protein VK602_05810 [Phyllobacterium sp.]|nr:hypothetical protein [Phyllobacterium sp.]
MMKFDPQVIIDVLGDEIGRVRAELGMELEKKMGSDVALAALEVLRGHVKGLHEHIDDLAKGMLHGDEVQEGFEGETLDALSGLRSELEKKADDAAVLAGMDALRGQLKDMQSLVDDLAQGMGDVAEERKAADAAWDAFRVDLTAVDARIEERAKEYETSLAGKVTADDLKALQKLADDNYAALDERVKQVAVDIADTFRICEELVGAFKTKAQDDLASRAMAIGEHITSVQQKFDKALEEKLDRADSVMAFDILRGQWDKSSEAFVDRLQKLEADLLRSIDDRVDALAERDDRLAAVDVAVRKLFDDHSKETQELIAGIKLPDVADDLQALRADVTALLDEATASIDATVHDVLDDAIRDFKREFKDLAIRFREYQADADKWLSDKETAVEARLADIKDGAEGPQGEAGKDGGQGPAGKDGATGKDGERGAPGVDAIPWEHLGTFDPTRVYRYHDTVIKDGGSFLSKANNNSGVPGDSPLWQLMAARGQRGKPGELGPQGLPGKGIVGPQGAQGEAALPFIEVRALEDRFAFVREDGEIFECNALPLLASLKGEFKSFIDEQVAVAVSAAVTKAMEARQKK